MFKFSIKHIVIAIMLIIIVIITVNIPNHADGKSQTTGAHHFNNSSNTVNMNNTYDNASPVHQQSDFDNVESVKIKSNALLGETTVEVLDYTNKLVLTSDDKLTLKYDKNLAQVNYTIKSGKVWVSIRPLKKSDFSVSVYYKNHLIGLISVNVIDYKLVKVSKSYTLSVEPYTTIDRVFSFSVKNDYSVNHTINVKVLNPSSDLTVEVNPVSLTLKPDEEGIINVRVQGLIRESPVMIKLSIDGVERYILINTHVLIVDVELLDNNVVIGSNNVLVFKITSNSEKDFYLYINDKYINKVHLEKGENEIKIDYPIPLPESGECYIKLVNKYGSIKLTLRNPFKEFNYYFSLNLMTNSPINITLVKNKLTFYKNTTDSTVIIFKNNNNYPVKLSPQFYMCDTKTYDTSNCEKVSNEFLVRFFEINGREFNSITLDKYQQKFYRLIIKPIKLYYDDFEKYLIISFKAEKIINNQTLPMRFDSKVVLKLENKVNVTQAKITTMFQYDYSGGGYIRVNIESPVLLPAQNVTVMYWVKGYNGSEFVQVREKTVVTISEFNGEYTLMINLPRGYKFFIFYIEVSSEKIQGSKLEYFYTQ